MAEIRYTFTASGHHDVAKAFRDIGTAADASNAAVQKSGAVAQRTARQHRQTARTAMGGTTSTERARRTSRQTDGAMYQHEVARAQKHTRDMAQADKSRTAAAAHELRSRKAIRDREDANLEGSVRRTIRRSDNLTGALDRDAKKQDKAARRTARAAARAQHERRQAWRSFGGQALTAGVIGMGMAGAAVAHYTGKAVRENWDLESQAALIASKGSMGTNRLSTKEVQRQLQETAVGTPGQTAEGVGAGVGAFISKVGEGKKAMEFRDIMTQMASASGARIEDIGSSMADLYSKSGITTKGGMRDILERWHVQGKTGAFELSDMAKFMPRVLSAGRVFGVEKGVEGASMVGALMQLVRGSTGSGAQAATGVENMLQTLIKKREEIQGKFGVSVFDKEGKGRGLTDILSEIAAAGKGDITSTTGIFTERGQKAMNAFLLEFKKFQEEGKSSTEALAALKAKIRETVEATGAHEESLKDAANNQDTMNAKMTAAWEGFKLSIMQTAQPAIDAFAKQLSGQGPRVGEAIGKLVAAIVTGSEGILDAFTWAADLLNPGGAKERAKKKAIAEATVQEEAAKEALAQSLPEGSGTAGHLIRGMQEQTLALATEKKQRLIFGEDRTSQDADEEVIGPRVFGARAAKHGVPQWMIDESISGAIEGNRRKAFAPAEAFPNDTGLRQLVEDMFTTRQMALQGGPSGDDARAQWQDSGEFVSQLDNAMKAAGSLATSVENAAKRIDAVKVSDFVSAPGYTPSKSPAGPRASTFFD